jgi:uncharacterized RDD family membrane protein YckC
MTTSDDPNAAPRGDSAPSGQQPAGLFRRFFARLIDSWIVVIALIPLVYLLHALTDISAISTPVRLVIIGLILGFATFAYFVVFEVTLGWTPAKKLFGLTVHGPGGARKPDLKQSAVRNAFELLWIAPNQVVGWVVVIAWIVIAVTIDRSPTSQGIHDRWAGGTQVVKN